MECSMTIVSCPNFLQNIWLILHSSAKLIFNLPRNGAYRHTYLQTYTIYQTVGHRTPHGGTAAVVRSTIRYKKISPPQLTALEVTAVNIPTRTNGAACAPPNWPLLTQDLTTLIQYMQHFIFSGDYNAKRKMWHSHLTNTIGRILHDHALRTLLLISQ
jgi:hypothetical protein